MTTADCCFHNENLKYPLSLSVECIALVPLAVFFFFFLIGLNSFDGPSLSPSSVKPQYGASGQHLDKMLHRSM